MASSLSHVAAGQSWSEADQPWQERSVSLQHSPPSSPSCLRDFKCQGLFILKIPKAFVSVIATCVTNSIFVS